MCLYKEFKSQILTLIIWQYMLVINQPNNHMLQHLQEVRPMFYLHLHTQCGIMLQPFMYLQILVYIQHTLLKQKDVIFRNYTCYVHGYVHLALKQPIIPPIHTPHIVGNWFTIMVYPIINKDKKICSTKCYCFNDNHYTNQY